MHALPWDCCQGMGTRNNSLPTQDSKAGHMPCRGRGRGRESFVHKPSHRCGQPAYTWGANKGRQTKAGANLCPGVHMEPGGVGDAPPSGCPQTWILAPTAILIYVCMALDQLPLLSAPPSHHLQIIQNSSFPPLREVCDPLPTSPELSTFSVLSLLHPQHTPKQKAAPS